MRFIEVILILAGVIGFWIWWRMRQDPNFSLFKFGGVKFQ